MQAVYFGWGKAWLRYRRNDTYYGVKHILTLGPWIFFIAPMTKDEMIAAIMGGELTAEQREALKAMLG